MRKNSERKVWSLSAAQESKACVSSASPVFVLFCFSVFSFYFVVFLKKQAILVSCSCRKVSWRTAQRKKKYSHSVLRRNRKRVFVLFCFLVVFFLFYCFFFLEKAIFRCANLFSVPAAYARYERGRENSVYSSGTNETITWKNTRSQEHPAFKLIVLSSL